MTPVELGAVLVLSATAYCLGPDAPGPHTASGTVPRPHWTAAADPRVLPLGSLVHVEGLGRRRVEDVGSAIKGHELDLFMASCQEAEQWGRRPRRVSVLALPGTGRTQQQEPRMRAGAVRDRVSGDDHGARVQQSSANPAGAALDRGAARSPAAASYSSRAVRGALMALAGALLLLGSALVWWSIGVEVEGEAWLGVGHPLTLAQPAPALARCEDCGGPVPVDRHGRCCACGSASVDRGGPGPLELARRRRQAAEQLAGAFLWRGQACACRGCELTR